MLRKIINCRWNLRSVDSRTRFIPVQNRLHERIGEWNIDYSRYGLFLSAVWRWRFINIFIISGIPQFTNKSVPPPSSGLALPMHADHYSALVKCLLRLNGRRSNLPMSGSRVRFSMSRFRVSRPWPWASRFLQPPELFQQIPFDRSFLRIPLLCRQRFRLLIADVKPSSSLPSACSCFPTSRINFPRHPVYLPRRRLTVIALFFPR